MFLMSVAKVSSRFLCVAGAFLDAGTATDMYTKTSWHASIHTFRCGLRSNRTFVTTLSHLNTPNSQAGKRTSTKRGKSSMSMFFTMVANTSSHAPGASLRAIPSMTSLHASLRDFRTASKNE